MKPDSVYRRSLAQLVADRVGLAGDLDLVSRILDATFDIIGEEMTAGHDVVFQGFGVFEGRRMNATTKIDPNTGRPVAVPPKIKPAFRASPTLKKKVNQ